MKSVVILTRPSNQSACLDCWYYISTLPYKLSTCVSDRVLGLLRAPCLRSIGPPWTSSFSFPRVSITAFIFRVIPLQVSRLVPYHPHPRFVCRNILWRLIDKQKWLMISFLNCIPSLYFLQRYAYSAQVKWTIRRWILSAPVSMFLFGLLSTLLNLGHLKCLQISVPFLDWA